LLEGGDVSSMSKLIAIETNRYSEFFRHLLAEYSDSAVVIDGSQCSAPEALSAWCTNAVICRTRDFLLKQNDIELCGFHDHPNETWMVESELPFVQRLAAENIIRFQVLDYNK
jgi:hypothetical protein